MPKIMKAYREPTREEIAICAYSIYEAEGRPQGKDREHWWQAEIHLIAQRKAEARLSSAKSASQTPAPAPQRGSKQIETIVSSPPPPAKASSQINNTGR